MWKTIVLLTCLLGTASVWGQVSVISVTDEDKHTRKEDFYHTFEYYITPTGEKRPLSANARPPVSGAAGLPRQPTAYSSPAKTGA